MPFFRRPRGTQCKNKVTVPSRSTTTEVKKSPSLCASEGSTCTLLSEASERAAATSNSSIEVARRFLQAFRKRDAYGMAAETCPNALFVFEEAEMPVDIFLEEALRIFESFPDFSFTIKSVKEVKPGTVLIEHLHVSATHTGPAYGFGPYPSVEAKGIKCKNDPEDIVLTIEDGLITKAFFRAFGPMTGPPGLYVQIGGLIF